MSTNLPAMLAELTEAQSSVYPTIDGLIREARRVRSLVEAAGELQAGYQTELAKIAPDDAKVEALSIQLRDALMEAGRKSEALTDRMTEATALIADVMPAVAAVLAELPPVPEPEPEEEES